MAMQHRTRTLECPVQKSGAQPVNRRATVTHLKEKQSWIPNRSGHMRAADLCRQPALRRAMPRPARPKSETCLGCHGIPGYNVYPTYHVPKLVASTPTISSRHSGPTGMASAPWHDERAGDEHERSRDMADIRCVLAGHGQVGKRQ